MYLLCSHNPEKFTTVLHLLYLFYLSREATQPQERHISISVYCSYYLKIKHILVQGHPSF